MNVKLRDGIDWVGYVDWTLRDFHSYVTTRGATYNAYLVRDEKTALVDAVKAQFVDRLLANVSALVALDNVDYVICNHAEPDHSGGLTRVMKALPNATLVCDAKCAQILSAYYDTTDWKMQIVSTGDTLSLGKRSFTFVETPMAHWPDSMCTYVPEEKLLFSMDAFGQHYASSGRFDDEVNMQEVMAEAKKYYANILMLYGKPVARALAAAGSLDIEMIAPAHGIIWRSHIDEILSAYQDWVVCKPKPKVLVIYDTMWESTRRMAEAIVEGASVEGVQVKSLFVRASGITEIATEVLDAAAIAFGSATLNMGMMPMMGAALTYLKGLKPEGKAGFAFGSFGWGKGGPEAIHEYLKTMRFDILREPLKRKWRPSEDALSECREAGKLLADKARELASV